MNRPSRAYSGLIGSARDRRPSKGKLLIIDDDRAFVVLAAAILRDAGYMVLEAYDAPQGFMFAQHDPPIVVLLDWLMPAGGGMNVLEHFRANARLSRMPIIVVTASTEPDLREQVLSKGRHRPPAQAAGPGSPARNR